MRHRIVPPHIVDKEGRACAHASRGGVGFVRRLTYSGSKSSGLHSRRLAHPYTHILHTRSEGTHNETMKDIVTLKQHTTTQTHKHARTHPPSTLANIEAAGWPCTRTRKRVKRRALIAHESSWRHPAVGADSGRVTGACRSQLAQNASSRSIS